MATTNKKQTKTKVNKEIKKTTKKKSVKNTAVSKKTTEKADKKVVEKVEKKSNVTETKSVTENKAPVKRRIVVNYNQLEPELIEVLNEKYPSGWRDYILKVEKGNGEFFHAIMLDTEDVSYLIKVSVKVDSDMRDDIEKDLFGLGHDDDFMVNDESDEEYDEKDDSLS